MQFVSGCEEAVGVLGSRSSETGKGNRTVMRQQQYIDFVLIPLYVSFIGIFAYFAQPRWLGIAAASVIFLAGIFDYLEDAAILAVCRGDAGQALFPVSFGLPKWILYFSALGVVAFCLIVYRSPAVGRSPALSRTFALVAGTLLALSAGLGVPGAFVLKNSHNGALLGLGFLGSLAALLAMLVFFLFALVQHRAEPELKSAAATR